MRKRLLGAVLCLLVVALMVSVEASAAVQGPRPSGSLAFPRSTSRALPPRVAESSGRTNTPSFPTPIKHVVIVMMENHNDSYVLQNGPFEASLANTYATAKNAYSVAHGSIPSYEAATSAFDNHTYPLAARNIGDLADGASISWDAFEQSMPTPCNRTINRTVGYLPVHNPFIMYDDIVRNATRCQAHDLTGAAWTTDIGLGTLPNYSFFAPNATNDGHTGGQAVSLAEADAWLKSFLPSLINDPAIFSDTAFLVAYDEGDKYDTSVVNGTMGGHVYTVAVSPYSKGLSSDHFYTTFSLLTTAEWLLGLPGGTLGTNDSWAVNPPMKDLFSFPSSTYNVEFTESGLPPATGWSVTLGAATQTSSSSTITFSEPNGSYSYSVGAVSGYTAIPGPGTVSLNGAPLSTPIAFVLSNPALQPLFEVYHSRPDLQLAYPNATNNTTALFGLVNWAGGVVENLWVDSNYTSLASFGYWYALMRTYDERPDLRSAFPNAYASSTSYSGLVTWAADAVRGIFSDGAAASLASYGYYYDLMGVYSTRPDLQSAFPNAYANVGSYQGLVTWAAGVVEGLWVDGSNAMLAPFGYWYALMATYNARGDLQSAFPNAYGNQSTYSELVTWAGYVVTGVNVDGSNATLQPFGYYYGLMGVYNTRPDLQTAYPDAYSSLPSFGGLVGWASDVVNGVYTDGANATLQPYGYYYDLMAVYSSRSDLQGAYPDAYASIASFTGLVTWAGYVVTGVNTDGANATLQPNGYYYDLMGVYAQRADLQSAYPHAFSNSASYTALLSWAKDVVDQVFPDGAYTVLEVYASYYIAHG